MVGDASVSTHIPGKAPVQKDRFVVDAWQGVSKFTLNIVNQAYILGYM